VYRAVVGTLRIYSLEVNYPTLSNEREGWAPDSQMFEGSWNPTSADSVQMWGTGVQRVLKIVIGRHSIVSQGDGWIGFGCSSCRDISGD
jgi:hypothetical protein